MAFIVSTYCAPLCPCMCRRLVDFGFLFVAVIVLIKSLWNIKSYLASSLYYKMSIDFLLELSGDNRPHSFDKPLEGHLYVAVTEVGRC